MFLSNGDEVQEKVLTFKQMKAMEEVMANSDGDCDDDEKDNDNNANYAEMFSGDIYEFQSSHPGSKFCHLAGLQHELIPKISLPREKLCNIEMLHINERIVNDSVKQYREDYAKMALLMFYPFRTLDNLKKDNSYWTLFEEQRRIYFNLDGHHKNSEKLKFWCKGFEILQNIQDRFTLEKKLKRARDPVVLQTSCRQPENSTNKKSCDENKESKIPDISEFCNDLK